MTKSANRGTATSRQLLGGARHVQAWCRCSPPASYSSFSRSRATSARPDSARSSVESRRVATLPGGPPLRSVGRWLTASSRSPARCTSSVAARPEASSSAVRPSRPELGRPGGPRRPRGRSSSRVRLVVGEQQPPVAADDEHALAHGVQHRVVVLVHPGHLGGPRPWVWRRSRLLTSAVPPVARASAAAAAPRSERELPVHDAAHLLDRDAGGDQADDLAVVRR